MEKATLIIAFFGGKCKANLEIGNCGFAAKGHV
jgi:hypothetical protein